MGTKTSWARLAVELALIIVGILSAFGIDAWWDARGEQAERRAVLAGLRLDFLHSLSLIDSITLGHAEVRGAARELMQFTGPSASLTTSPDSVKRLVLTLTNRYRTRPTQGTLTSLLNSGRWDLLRDDAELQTALAEWPIILADLNAREEEAVEGINNRLLPRLWQLAPIRNLDMLDTAFHEVGPSRFPPGYERLLSDLYFEGAVDERWWDSHQAITMLEKVRGHAEGIVALIDAALARQGG